MGRTSATTPFAAALGTAPVAATDVPRTPSTPAYTSVRPHPCDLVGRTQELRALLDAVTRAPAVVLVEGEAGVGKTRLVHEALRSPRLGRRRALWGHCQPLREPFPYGPVFDLLRRLAGDLPDGLNAICGALRPYLPELDDGLPPALEPLPDARADRHRLYRAVRALLQALGESVLVVEDLHWADDGTRDLLRYLVDDLPHHLSVIVTYRPEDLPCARLPLGRAYRQPPGTTSVLLPLRPLGASEVRSMYAELAGDAEPPAAFVADLHARTAGIPFVVEEVVRALAAGEERDGRGRAALEAMEAPALLQEAMADRMSGLSPGAVQVVQAVAVLRLPAGERLIDLVVRQEAEEDGALPPSRPPSRVPVGCLPAIREALAARVLYECDADRYGFRHSLAQRAVYARLSRLDRRRLHRCAVRALEALDGPKPWVQLAYHARHAKEPVLWQRCAEEAASAARAVGDRAVAVEVLEELLSQGELGRADRIRIAIRLSQDAVTGLTHRRIIRLLRNVMADTGISRAQRGEVRLNLGLLLKNQAGRYDEGRVETELAVDELWDRPALAARGMAALAMPSWGSHPCEVHERWIRRAEELVADEPDLSVRTAVRGNRLALMMSVGDPGAWEQAELLLGEAEADRDHHQLARAYGNFADAASWLGHPEIAQRYRTAGRERAAECGAGFVEGIMEGTALRLDWYAGRWEGLSGRCRHTLDVVQGDSGIAADAHLVLGLLASVLGDADEALSELRAAGPADPGNAPAPVLAAASGAMVGLLLDRGEVGAARMEAERGMARIRHKGIWPWAGELAPMAVRAWVRGGHLGEAERVTAEFAEGLQGRDAPRAAAALAACGGIVAEGQGRTEEAADAFASAHRAFVELGEPYSAARAREAADRCRIGCGGGEGEAAARSLASLADEFTTLGATRDAERCRRLLRGTGVGTPSRRGRRGYGDQLSPREAEVVHLVSLGHTNRHIAEVLFLSPRTVEQHVARAMKKLRVTSRGEIPKGWGGEP